MTKNKPNHDLTTDLRNAVRETVSREDVKYVIGYGRGSYATQTKPVFIESPEDADKIIWSPLCVNNLPVFFKLAEKLPVPRGQEPDTRKVGVIVKGCDVRAVVLLIQEQNIKREDIIIIGISCDRCVDPDKLENKILEKGIALNSDLNTYWMNGNLIVEDRNRKEVVMELGATELILEKCKRCEVPTPEFNDILIGEKLEPWGQDDFSDLKGLEDMTHEDKERFWDNQFDKCIRCYACRNICPVCTCKTCVLDSLKPQWVNRSTDFDSKKLFHMMRAYCMLGRCIDCGECERACPVFIPLTKLYRKGLKTVKELFDYEPGKNPSEKPVFTRYDTEDLGGIIW